VIVLEIVRYCLEYGFFRAELGERLAAAMGDVMISLRKLENGWRERIALRREHPEKYSDIVENIKFGGKLDEVAANLGKCKGHMAAIVVQVVTLLFDARFYEMFPSFYYKKMKL
jgi:hypothetical protein